jgi:hypothetical protein
LDIVYQNRFTQDAPPEQCLIAAIYREMADFAFSGDDPEALSKKEKLPTKLRAMAVANGCTEAERK